ncbi:MAG: ABC transporter ATP-binding protein [Marmoricola sp.]|nr:ABC transporter ATP-binding protein [Marmoricola sp.]
MVFDGRVRRGDFELTVAFAVAPGEVLAVLGPNGAGKSTLLRTIAGLEPLASGRVSVGGEVWADGDVDLPPDERAAGVVFQDYRLFPHLDVRDNVAFPSQARGLSRSRARTAATEWLARLELADLARRRPAQLSGGQAQRVALARALATEPRVLLLDEPMAALDASARIDVRAFLRAHLRDFTGPVVLVTHDPLEAMVLADRMLVVEGGRVVQDGSPAEVARRPASSYVARLVGLNLWPGRLEPDGLVTLDGGGRIAVTAPVEPGPVLVSLRPSAVTVLLEQPDGLSARNVWPGRVSAMELLADRVRLEVSGPPETLVDVTQAAVAELGLDVGVRVWLAAKATETDAYPDPGSADAAR